MAVEWGLAEEIFSVKIYFLFLQHWQSSFNQTCHIIEENLFTLFCLLFITSAMITDLITLSLCDILCNAFFWVVWTCAYFISPSELLHSALMKNHLRKRNRLRKKALKHRRNPPWSTAPQSRPRLLKHSSARPLTLLLCAPLLPWSVRTERTWRLWARATVSGPRAARWRRSTSHSCTNTLTRMETCRRLLTVRLASYVRTYGVVVLQLETKMLQICVFCR